MMAFWSIYNCFIPVSKTIGAAFNKMSSVLCFGNDAFPVVTRASCLFYKNSTDGSKCDLNMHGTLLHAEIVCAFGGRIYIYN